MLEFCVSAAVFAYVFSCVLTMPGEILGFYGDFLERVHASRPWLAKPLGYCAKCFAGQVAFWSFPFYWDGFNPVRHAVAIFGTILLTQIILLCLKKLQS
jgi:hypothetical protein